MTFNLDKIYLPNENYLGFPNLAAVHSLDIDKWDSWKLRQNRVLLHTGLHFFCDDSFYECLWSYPDRYIDILMSYGSIVMPDFSLYYDMPVALQMFNKYRNHVLARYFSNYGIKVIPNVSLSAPDCFPWSILGYPKESIVAFSALGSKRSDSDFRILCDAYDFMCDKLNPSLVLWFDSSPLAMPDDGRCIWIKAGGFLDG